MLSDTVFLLFLVIKMSILKIAIILTVLFHDVYCSAGDKDPQFRACVRNCMVKCGEKILLSWGCRGDCEYHCMFLITEERTKLGYGIYQYYGKWPFYRLFGVIQEPASFFFAIMNFVSQLMGWYHYTSLINPRFKFYSLAKAQFLINSFAWLCATIFHARDTYWTEKFDYFSAALVLAISMFTCFSHIAGTFHSFKVILLGLLLVIVFSFHIFYMAFIHFDYGLNMKFLLLSGIINVFLWLAWSWYCRKRRPVGKCVLTMILTLTLASLEVFDFPPIFWIFDSHSLWHLSTIPIPYIWFTFLAEHALNDQLKLQYD